MLLRTDISITRAGVRPLGYLLHHKTFISVLGSYYPIWWMSILCGSNPRRVHLCADLYHLPLAWEECLLGQRNGDHRKARNPHRHLKYKKLCVVLHDSNCTLVEDFTYKWQSSRIHQLHGH